jgi:hypothetical protein
VTVIIAQLIPKFRKMQKYSMNVEKSNKFRKTQKNSEYAENSAI